MLLLYICIQIQTKGRIQKPQSRKHSPRASNDQIFLKKSVKISESEFCVHMKIVYKRLHSTSRKMLWPRDSIFICPQGHPDECSHFWFGETFHCIFLSLYQCIPSPLSRYFPFSGENFFSAPPLHSEVYSEVYRVIFFTGTPLKSQSMDNLG